MIRRTLSGNDRRFIAAQRARGDFCDERVVNRSEVRGLMGEFGGGDGGGDVGGYGGG